MTHFDLSLDHFPVLGESGVRQFYQGAPTKYKTKTNLFNQIQKQDYIETKEEMGNPADRSDSEVYPKQHTNPDRKKTDIDQAEKRS